MFAFSGLSYETNVSGGRNWTYDTPDALEEVQHRSYFKYVGDLFADGDYILINAADQQVILPILSPDYREAPSGLLH